MTDQDDINEAIGKIANGNKYLILTLGGKYTSYSQEVIKNSASPQNFKHTLADAFVINSTHQRLLVNFYMKVVKPPVPTRYFEEQEEAIKWLHSLFKKWSAARIKGCRLNHLEGPIFDESLSGIKLIYL